MALYYVPMSSQTVFYDGLAISGAKIFVYNAGTNTPRTAYNSSAGTTTHTSPFFTDSNGSIPAFWVVSGNDIKIVIKNTDDTVIKTIDGIPTSIPEMTSSELKSKITDETGAGALVFANSPTINTPIIVTDGAEFSNPANSISDLRGFVPNIDPVYVSGYYTSGDGGQGVFRPVTGAAPGTYVDNGGTIIVPTGGNGSAAWIRQFNSEIDVRWFGASPSLSDNASFIQAAFNYLVSIGGGTIYFSGVFRVRSQIVVTSNAKQSITVVGDGRYVSAFDFSNGASLGLSLVSTSLVDNQLPKYEIKDVGFITSSKNSGTALSITYANANNLQFTALISNVLIGQNLDRISDSGADYGYWSKGIYLNNCRNALIMNLHGFGEMDISPRSSIGIHMEGECTSLMIANTRMIEWTTHVLAEGLTEGLYVHNTDIVFGLYGLRHTSTLGSQPQLTVTDSHFNTSIIGVWAQDIQQSVVANCLIYASQLYYTSGWPEWTGVLIQGTYGRYNKVIGCTFGKESGRTGDITNGIDFNQGFYYQATGNTFFGWSGNQMTNGIIVRSGVGHVSISEDNQYENVATKVLNSGQWAIVQPQVQKGTTAAVTTGTAITFPQQFENTPVVTANHSGTTNNISVAINNITTTGFTIYHNAGSAVAFNWIATG